MSYNMLHKHSRMMLNKSFINQSILLLSVCLFSTEVYSQTPLKNGVGWSGKLSLGVSSSVGNTNLNRLNADFVAKYKTQTPWQHTIQGGISKAQRAPRRGANTIETKNTNELNYKLDYYLDKKSAIVGYIGYEDDKKAKLESQTMVGVGYERYKMGTPRHLFSAGLGLGHLDVKYSDGTPGFKGAALRGSLGYKGKITDNISFRQKAVVLSSKDRTMTRIVSSLSYALTEKVSIALRNKVTHNSLIPATAIDKTDSSTALNLVVNF